MESTPPRAAMEVSTTALRGAMDASSPTQQPRGAIAYLAQGVRHSTYGRDSLPTRRRAAGRTPSAASGSASCSARARATSRATASAG